MRSILIDPYIRRIDELDIKDDLEVFRAIIDCETLAATPWWIDGEKLALWLDDAGFLNGRVSWLRTTIVQLKPRMRKRLTLESPGLEPRTRDFVHQGDHIYGRALVIGVTSGGNHRDLKIDLLRLSEFVLWQS